MKQDSALIRTLTHSLVMHVPIKKILVAVNMNQKDDVAITTKGGLSLFIKPKIGTFDGNVANPVLAKVVAIGSGVNMDELHPDDFILCHHNTFARTVTEGYLADDTGVKTHDGLSIFSINKSMIYCKVDRKTAEPIPITGMLIVKRITKAAFVSKFFECPETLMATLKTAFVVEKVGLGCDGIKVGDGIVTYEKSDVTMSYNLLEQDHTYVRVWYNDVHAIFHQDLIPMLSNVSEFKLMKDAHRHKK